MMYKVDDLVMYGSEGVCRVMDICTPDFSGIKKDKLYYILEPVYKNGKVYTPVNTNKFMRPVMTREDAKKLMDKIPSITLDVYDDTHTEQTEDHYKELLQSHDCLNLMKLIKTLLFKKCSAISHSRKLGMTDESYLDRAEDMLFSEFATALSTPKDTIKKYVEDGMSEPEIISI